MIAGWCGGFLLAGRWVGVYSFNVRTFYVKKCNLSKLISRRDHVHVCFLLFMLHSKLKVAAVGGAGICRWLCKDTPLSYFVLHVASSTTEEVYWTASVVLTIIRILDELLHLVVLLHHLYIWFSKYTHSTHVYS